MTFFSQQPPDNFMLSNNLLNYIYVRLSIHLLGLYPVVDSSAAERWFNQLFNLVHPYDPGRTSKGRYSVPYVDSRRFESTREVTSIGIVPNLHILAGPRCLTLEKNVIIRYCTAVAPSL